MIAWLSQPWPWYVSGAMIAFVMFLLIFFGKGFGLSSNLRTLCSMCGAGKTCDFFDFDWKGQRWNLLFILGALIGGFVAGNFLASPEPLALSEATVQDLAALNIAFDGKLVPEALFSWSNLLTVRGFLLFAVGGFLVGFGARYAGGCTSGHAISGISNLQWPSLLAVVGFFIGGLFITHFVYPLIF